MGANARTAKGGERGVEVEDNKVLDAYGKKTRNYKGEYLSPFAANHDLALVNTLFSTRKSGTSRTFNSHWQENE